jgi:ParB family chromosome partitioning protein
MAGMTELPVVIRHVTEAEAYELALIENIQREDLNPLEEAEAYRRLIDEHGYTQEALANRVGKSRPTVSNALRLLKLGPSLREKLLRGALSAGHARALLATADLSYRERLACRIEDDGISVREVEHLVACHQATPTTLSKIQKRITTNTPSHHSFCDLLQSRLGRNVRIRNKRSGAGGTLVIAFKNDADLKRLIADLA